MKAVVFNEGLKLVKDYKKPEPKKGEALVRVTLAGICNTDYEITKGYMGYKGIVLEAYGAGGIPFSENEDKDIDKAVKRLTEKGMVFVCTTQCLYDGVHMDRYEVGIKAVEAGIIPAGKYSAEAATVKLMTALGRKMTHSQIRQLF